MSFPTLTICLVLFLPVCLVGAKSHIGCYEEQPYRELWVASATFNDNRPSKCIQFCRDEEQLYAGLQNGNQCWCGDYYGYYGELSLSRCNMRCPGDSTLYCGGPWANLIYSTN